MKKKNSNKKEGKKKVENTQTLSEFISRKGHLSIKINDIIYKFCEGCGDRLRGD